MLSGRHRPSPTDANDLAIEATVCRESGIDAVRQSDEVPVEGTDDDAGATGSRWKQMGHRPTVEGEQGAVSGDCRVEHVFVDAFVVQSSGLVQSNDVVTQATQLDYDRLWKSIVGEQSGHSLCCLVLLDFAIDLIPMRPDVDPGIWQILGPE
jgi:hypothetical protein